MNAAELLTATGNVWEVVCYKDGNGRILLGRWYIRSGSKDRARAKALKLSGGKYAVLWPWDPQKDLRTSQYVRAIQEGQT